MLRLPPDDEIESLRAELRSLLPAVVAVYGPTSSLTRLLCRAIVTPEVDAEAKLRRLRLATFAVSQTPPEGQLRLLAELGEPATLVPSFASSQNG